MCLRENCAEGEPSTNPGGEIKRLFLAKLTYGQIAAGAGMTVLLIFWVALKGGLLSGWNLAWIIMALVIPILAAVQAFRKWRFDSAQS